MPFLLEGLSVLDSNLFLTVQNFLDEIYPAHREAQSVVYIIGTTGVIYTTAMAALTCCSALISLGKSSKRYIFRRILFGAMMVPLGCVAYNTGRISINVIKVADKFPCYLNCFGLLPGLNVGATTEAILKGTFLCRPFVGEVVLHFHQLMRRDGLHPFS